MRAAVWLPLALTGLLAPALAAQEPPRVVTTRIGHHASFDRIVLELDAPAAVVWQEREDGELEVRIGARDARSGRTTSYLGFRAAALRIEPDDGWVVVRADAPPGPVRVFTLTTPPRVVVDFAAPGAAPFEAPAGSREVPLTRSEPEPQPEPEPRIEPTLATPEPALPEPTPPRPPEPPPPVTRRAPARPPPSLPGDGPGALLLFAAGLGVVLLASAVAIFVRRSRRGIDLHAADFVTAEAVGPETITQEELASGNRVELLEKRLDDEVRARVQLEERLAGLLEEQKVLRDRLRRVKRERP